MAIPEKPHAHSKTPVRSTPFDQEPGFDPDAGLWLYGNARLLDAKLICLPDAFGHPVHSPEDLNQLEREAEEHVLAGRTIVTGIHSPCHQRVAVVPLRWGAPRILVLSGGFYYHLGRSLKEEPFRVARLWRYQFDERCDLVVSRRAPDKLPTFSHHNPTVDKLVRLVVSREIPSLLFGGR